jgi:hypothetical protein
MDDDELSVVFSRKSSGVTDHMLTASRPRDARDHQRARGRRAEPLAHEKLGANDLDVPGHPGPAQLAQGVEVGRPKVVGKCPANLVGRVNPPGGDAPAQCLGRHVDQDDLAGTHEFVRH